MKRLFLVLILCPIFAHAVGGSFEASNNISGQGDSIYVNITGDTMTGTLNGTEQRLTGQLIVGGSVTVQGAGLFSGSSGIYGVSISSNIRVATDRIVTRNGRVGLLTADPGSDVQIGGDMTNTSVGTTLAILSKAGNEKAIQIADTDGNAAYGEYWKHLYSAGSIGTLGTRHNGVDTDAISWKFGNVGIGTVAPDAKLSISSSTASTAFISFLGAMTKAEILAFDPVQAGASAYCTDCVTATHCISTGTAVTQFADIGDRTVACN